MRERVEALLAGRYTVLEEVGRGGMAVVFRARDDRHGRHVALKVLREDLSALIGPERFLQEVRITAGLNHPHILPLLDSGEADGLLFYSMPLVPGRSLRELLVREGRLSSEVALRVADQVASALDHAHAQGIVHRDVKPENVLLWEGQAMVADFGMARALSSVEPRRLTGTGVHLGTLGYMSPEQAAGALELDEATDVFALSAVVYEMLVGETPRRWMTDEAVRMGRFLDAPAEHRGHLDELPGRLEQVLVRGMALEPRMRFESCGALIRAAEAASEGSPKLNDQQVRDIVQRATELEVEDHGHERALSLGGVEQVAAQVGIPPERVRQAAMDVERARTAPLAERNAQSRGDSVAVERTIPAEVGPSRHEAVVAEIQASLGIVGHVSNVGQGMTWSPAAAGIEERKIVVTLTPRDGTTRIHVEERFEFGGPRMMIPAGGAFIGLMSMATVLASFGFMESPWAIIPVVLAGLTGGALGANGYLGWQRNRRGPELEALADRIAQLGEDGGS
jgi:tRNA A-37 threonylcarbamoyl transferase component Bud32